jgi:steroid delta-isomerase-like uncharacterized protein
MAAGSAGPSAARLLTRGLAALADSDVERFTRLWAEDVVYDVVALGRRFEGRPRARAFVEELVTAIEDLHVETLAVHGGADGVAVGEWRLTGWFAGGPFQGIEPTGRRVDLRGVDVTRWRHGLLRHTAVYHDAATFSRQVGALPRAGGPADRVLVRSINRATRLRRLLERRPGPPAPAATVAVLPLRTPPPGPATTGTLVSAAPPSRVSVPHLRLVGGREHPGGGDQELRRPR